MATIKISALPAASGIDAVNDVLPIVQSSVTNKISRNTLLGIAGSPVGTSDTQVLSNKTLGNTNAATLLSTNFTLQDNSDSSKQATFILSGITTGTTRHISVPNFDVTLVGATATQTLTNKTLTAPAITSPSITGTVSGSATYSTPTLTVPVIADFSSANHTHKTTPQGGTLQVTAGGASTSLVDQNGNALDVEGRANTTFEYFVESGLVWTAGAGLLGSMTSGVVWINGQRISVSSVSNHAFTASKDTYVDIDITGTVNYTEASNNAASPALSANRIRIAIIVTTGSAIASGGINQGSSAAILPIASSVPYCVTDSLGNLIYNNNPNPIQIGYRQITASTTVTAPTTASLIPGLSAPVIIPTGRKVRVTIDFGLNISNSSATAASAGIAITAAADANRLKQGTWNATLAGQGGTPGILQFEDTSRTGSQTYVGYVRTATGNITINADPLSPAFISVDLI